MISQILTLAAGALSARQTKFGLLNWRMIALATSLAACSPQKPKVETATVNTTIATSVNPAPAPATATPTESANGDEDAAVERRYSAAYRQCMKSEDASNGVTSALIDCTREEADRQDAILNADYKTAMATAVDAEAKDHLRSVERLWIKERDATCNREAEEDAGGSLAGLTLNGCILRATVKRVMELDSQN